MNLLNQYGVSDRFLSQATMFPDYILARVVAQYRGKYKIVTEQKELMAEISGKLRYDINELAMYPAVGDYVMIDAAEDTAVIHHVLTRKSLFVRKAVGVSSQAQPIAANVDIAFLCMSLNQNYNLNRMERYLSIAWDSGATPVVVLTKADLSHDLSSSVEQIEKISYYSDVITVSMYDEDVCEKFLPYFQKNQTCAFIGSSGVGKSTIINKLLGESVIATQETGKGDKGRHTTTGREMFPCPLGGVVIDTPGMREMGAEGVDLSKTFTDISELAQQCQFRDCTHTNEPGCAILQAVENGELDMRRLENYRKLEQEASYDGLSSKEIEIKKSERMFKDVGGMKNVRRYAREHNKRK